VVSCFEVSALGGIVSSWRYFWFSSFQSSGLKRVWYGQKFQHTRVNGKGCRCLHWKETPSHDQHWQNKVLTAVVWFNIGYFPTCSCSNWRKPCRNTRLCASNYVSYVQLMHQSQSLSVLRLIVDGKEIAGQTRRPIWCRWRSVAGLRISFIWRMFCHWSCFYPSTTIGQIVYFYVKLQLFVLFILPSIWEICSCSVTDFEILVKFHGGTQDA
jgi:hypothetical protein